jgi:hypothetical protein
MTKTLEEAIRQSVPYLQKFHIENIATAVRSFYAEKLSVEEIEKMIEDFTSGKKSDFYANRPWREYIRDFATAISAKVRGV